LLQELHKDPAKAGQYDYKAVKKWTKSGDIFSKDKLLFPIHVGRQHWIWVMVDRLKKKIQVFDSGGQSRHRKYLEAILQYLNDEHKAKENSPPPDFDQWELVGSTSDTPRQENGKYYLC